MREAHAGWEFWVAGKAITQGSKDAGINRHTGRVFVRESAGSALVMWRHAVSTEARRALESDGGMMIGPVCVEAHFKLVRPKSAPKRIRIWPVKRGLDIDKGVRAILDAMTQVLYLDDSQVVWLLATKDYADDKGPGVLIRVFPREEPAA